MSEKPGLPFAQKLGNEAVDITVGSGDHARKYHIHKSILCEHSDFFQKMFNSNLLEGITNTATLPEDDPNTFEVFVGWIYRGTIEVPNTTTREKFNSRVGSLKLLFFFAEKYSLVPIMDRAMNMLIEHQNATHTLFTCDSMRNVYQTTRQTSRLRLYASRTFAYVMMHFGDGERGDNWATNELQQLAVDEPDIMLNAMMALRKHDGLPIDHPRKAPKCDYHQHGPKEPCPYESDR
ncbi:hypothetical protein BJ878DRAFT_482108 [Calycina marina]|uniref:BTB domain-containing protein n=1 Tax=Calycina marina TaxID=1763456 RepID=A0A9P7YYU8_9HELO|nr:hypothetical protein BJ878DRAFT_482108 [Calycina marina]